MYAKLLMLLFPFLRIRIVKWSASRPFRRVIDLMSPT
jgi:hypothetical protein